MDFNKLIKSVIEPLLCSLKFTVKEDINGILEYENADLIITMSYDYNASYEVDMTWLFKRSGLFYGYNELKKYFYGGNGDYLAIQIKEEDVLIKWLKEASGFLKEHLSKVIYDSEEVKTGLEQISQRRIDDYERAQNSRLLNTGVEQYWTNKDYSGLVKFLKSYHGVLEGSVKKKYDYALKMIGE
jgi:hypothetical protein